MERIVYLVAYTYKPVKTDKTKKGKSKVIDCFRDELELIKNDDINNFVMEVLRLAPGYFFSIPSSSTGKYHPKYEYCTGGLTIHTRAVVYFLTNLLELDMFRKEFTLRERELLIAAAILHDVKKMVKIHKVNTLCLSIPDLQVSSLSLSKVVELSQMKKYNILQIV